jgi:hypothetical protein
MTGPGHYDNNKNIEKLSVHPSSRQQTFAPSKIETIKNQFINAI